MLNRIENHGFLVRELQKEDTDKIFEIFRKELGKDKNKSVQNKKLRKLKREIEFTFKEDGHHIVGVQISGTLIGVATCNKDNGIPWLGHFVIDDKYRKTKATAMLLYYIMGEVYPDEIIQTRPIGDTSDYGNSIKKMPKIMNFDILNPERFKLLKKIAGV